MRRTRWAAGYLTFGCTAAHAQTAKPSLKEITVTGNPLGVTELITPATQYSGSGLLLRSKTTLGETLDGTPGVSSTYFGPNARPCRALHPGASALRCCGQAGLGEQRSVLTTSGHNRACRRRRLAPPQPTRCGIRQLPTASRQAARRCCGTPGWTTSPTSWPTALHGC